jgi:hypothetical protein
LSEEHVKDFEEISAEDLWAAQELIKEEMSKTENPLKVPESVR